MKKNKLLISLLLLQGFVSVYADTNDSELSVRDKQLVKDAKSFQSRMDEMAQKSEELQDFKKTNEAFQNKKLSDPNIDQKKLEAYQQDMDTQFKNSKQKEILEAKQSANNASKKLEENKESIPPQLAGIDYNKKLTIEQMQAIDKDAKAFVEYSLNAIEHAPKEIKELGEALRRRGEKLTVESIERERERVAKLAGVDLKGPGTLYYFLSFEMPIEMIRTYVIESIYTKGVIVFRGMREGRTQIKDFAKKDIMPLMYGSNNKQQVAIKIEPQLFDAYKVTVAPTIIYSENLEGLYCFIPNEWTYEQKKQVTKEVNGQQVTETEVKKIPLRTESCLPLNPDKYWKITGAVTTHYALEQFIEKGATKAQDYLDKLKDAYTGTPPKEAKPFKGEWKEPVTKSDNAMFKELNDYATIKHDQAETILKELTAPSINQIKNN